MPVSLSKIEKYRHEANRCAELAKEARPAFLAEIYRKVALRYVFMAEELLRGAVRRQRHRKGGPYELFAPV